MTLPIAKITVSVVDE